MLLDGKQQGGDNSGHAEAGGPWEPNAAKAAAASRAQFLVRISRPTVTMAGSGSPYFRTRLGKGRALLSTSSQQPQPLLRNQNSNKPSEDTSEPALLSKSPKRIQHPPSGSPVAPGAADGQRAQHRAAETPQR